MSSTETQEREPLQPRSQFIHRRLFDQCSMRYHTDLRGQRVVFCGCGPSFRGESRTPSPLGRGRHKDDRWASDYRYRWARRA